MSASQLSLALRPLNHAELSTVEGGIPHVVIFLIGFGIGYKIMDDALPGYKQNVGESGAPKSDNDARPPVLR